METLDMNHSSEIYDSEMHNNTDNHVDDLMIQCLTLSNPKSFFLYAGAGSGKTRSLIKALQSVRSAYGNKLRLRGRQIAVITYTNAACDEITRRLEIDPLFYVSTIHSFIWEMIKGFNSDIRSWLRGNLEEEIAQLTEEAKKGKPGTKAAADRDKSIRSKNKRLEKLPSIRRFIYSPTGENSSRESLNHAEVVKMGAAFITHKSLCQQLIISRFPIILIDESQDTHSLLVDALIKLQAYNSDRFALGLLGDTMQRIYSDGKTDIESDLPPDWLRLEKVMNHRSSIRIVRLINKVRYRVDGKEQHPRSDAKDGLVRLFVSSLEADRDSTERNAREIMAKVTNDHLWSKSDKVKMLMLEHRMSARRLGFLDMYNPLYSVDSFRTQLLQGSLPMLQFFSELIWPLVEAKIQGSLYIIANILKKSSPLLRHDSLENAGEDQRTNILRAKAAVAELTKLCSMPNNPTFREVLQCVANSKLFDIPETLAPFLNQDSTRENQSQYTDPEVTESDKGTKLHAIDSFLGTQFIQIQAYSDYVNGKTAFATHQGVKGLEFPRVLVVMDDKEAGGFLFSYEKLFGSKEQSETDVKNQLEGKETGIDRTRRLFYVTCSRAIESLALVAYASDPEKVRKYAVQERWFEQEEISILSY